MSAPPNVSTNKRAKPDKTTKVALVCMPFAALQRPLLGISLLKAGLDQHGVACDVHYLNLPYARRIGLATYDWIEQSSTSLFLGEWFFSRALFGEDVDVEHPLFEGLRRVDSKSDSLPDDFETSLREARQEVEGFLDDCLSSIIPWERYRIIGFGTTFQQTIPSLALAQRIKNRWPEKIIVFGGANCEGERGLELHRQFPFVDYVCRGESDILFPELVKNLLAGTLPGFLPGLVVRDQSGQSMPIGSGALPVMNLDSLPFPDFDDYFQQVSESKLNLRNGRLPVVFETSRGCWYGEKHQCTFCGFNGQTMAFRRKSPERAFEEMRYLAEHYPGSQAQATDTILDMEYLRNLMLMLIESGMEWSMAYAIKANLRRDQFHLLKRAGMNHVQPGIESLSTSVLKLMHKGCTALQNIQLLKWASELGIVINWNFLWGFPEEDPTEYDRMAELIPALIHLRPPLGFGRIRLERFSPYFQDPDGMGMTNVRPAACYRVAYPGLSEESLARLAYYFDYDYADGRDPSTYTARLERMIRYWQANHCPGALTSIANDHSMTIHDLRPGAKRRRLELPGMEKAIFEYCDQAHNRQAIQVHMAELGYEVDEDVLLEMLRSWVADRLMIREGDWYLSLVVRADELVESVSDSDMVRRVIVDVTADVLDAAWHRGIRQTEAARIG